MNIKFMGDFVCVDERLIVSKELSFAQIENLLTELKNVPKMYTTVFDISSFVNWYELTGCLISNLERIGIGASIIFGATKITHVSEHLVVGESLTTHTLNSSQKAEIAS